MAKRKRYKVVVTCDSADRGWQSGIWMVETTSKRKAARLARMHQRHAYGRRLMTTVYREEK